MRKKSEKVYVKKLKVLSLSLITTAFYIFSSILLICIFKFIYNTVNNSFIKQILIEYIPHIRMVLGARITMENIVITITEPTVRCKREILIK